MKILRTLYAERIGTSVRVTNERGRIKGIFPNTGYRPTKATKKIMLNCFYYLLKWK